MTYLKYFFEFKKINYLAFYLTILPSIIINILYLTNPIYMMHIYDSIIASQSDINLFSISIIAFFLYIMFFCFDLIRSLIFIETSHSIERFFKIYIISITNTHNLDKYSLLSIISALDELKKFIKSPVLPALFDLIFAPIFIILSFYINPILGLWAIISAILIIAITYLFSIKNEQLRKISAEKQFSGIQFEKAVLSQAEHLNIAPARDLLLTHWDKKRSSTQKHQLILAKTSCYGISLIKTLRMALQSSILGLGSWLVMHHNLSSGSIIATSIITTRAIAPLEQLMNAKQSLKIGFESLKLLIDLRFFSESKNIPDKSINNDAKQPINGNIIGENITLLHNKTSLPICNNFSFMITEGEYCSIYGSNGCGKTSFLLCLLGLITPKSGTISLGGQNSNINLMKCFSSNIGYLSSNCTLFPISIAENITLSNDNNTLEIAKKAATTAGCHDEISSLEDGYQTIISPKKISYSLTQQIRLARTIAHNPRILLMDDPTQYLNSDAKQHLYTLLKKIKNKGKTIVIVSHDPTIIKMSDLSIIFNHTAEPFFGSTQDIFKSKIITKNKIKT